MTMPTQTNGSPTSSLYISDEHKPFNLFGLTGDRSDLIQRAWYGEPEDKPTVDAITWLDVLLFGTNGVSFGLLLVLFGTEDGLLAMLNFHPSWEKRAQALLSLVWVTTLAWIALKFLRRILFPRSEERERDAEKKRRNELAKKKNSLTLELYSPQSDGRRPRRVENENQPVMMRRNRQSPAVQLGSLRTASKFIVTLEGLTSAEQERLYAEYLHLSS